MKINIYRSLLYKNQVSIISEKYNDLNQNSLYIYINLIMSMRFLVAYSTNVTTNF